jgi:hypothetical protein
VNKPPFATPYVQYELIDDILHVVLLPGNVITLDIAIDIVKQRLAYIEGKSYPILLSGEGLREIKKDARDHMSKEGQTGVLAGAILVHSVYTEFFGNFYLKVNAAEIPSKLFTDKQEALEWLNQFKPKT